MIPLVVLAFFSLTAGFIELPGSMGSFHVFSDYVNTLLPAVILSHENVPEIVFQLLAAVISLSGIYLAYLLWLRKPAFSVSFEKSRISHFFYKGWGFDWLYDLLFVRPVVWLAEVDKDDFIDFFSKSLAWITVSFNRLLSLMQNGKVRWAVMAFAIGIVFILTIMMNL